MKITPITFEKALPKILETSISNKAMLQAIIMELSNGNQVKEDKIISIANELKAVELLNLEKEYSSENTD
jgi:hypothetical protein